MLQGIVGGIVGGLLVTIALYLVVREGARRNMLHDLEIYEGLLEMVRVARMRVTVLELFLLERGLVGPEELQERRKEWEAKLAAEEAVNPEYAELWTLQQRVEKLRRQVKEGRRCGES